MTHQKVVQPRLVPAALALALLGIFTVTPPWVFPAASRWHRATCGPHMLVQCDETLDTQKGFFGSRVSPLCLEGVIGHSSAHSRDWDVGRTVSDLWIPSFPFSGLWPKVWSVHT